MNETSLTRAANPVSVFIASTLDTSTGLVALAGLRRESAMMKKCLATCTDCEHEWVEVFWAGEDGKITAIQSLKGDLVCPECKSEDIDILGYSKVTRG